MGKYKAPRCPLSGKVRYPNTRDGWKRARGKAKHLERKETDPHMSAYLCECGGVHQGHTPREKQEHRAVTPLSRLKAARMIRREVDDGDGADEDGEYLAHLL